MPLEQSPEALGPLSNEPTEADKLWEDLEELTSPTSEQLDLFLEKFLVLPPGETDWSDLLHLFSSHHTDLPSVFRRIAAEVTHTKEEGISYFFCAPESILEESSAFTPGRISMRINDLCSNQRIGIGYR